MSKKAAAPKIRKCSKCGKLLGLKNTSGIGHLCEQNLTPHMFPVSRIPAGYVTVQSMHEFCDANEIPVARMVKAFGRDRGVTQPTCLAAAAVYFGHNRYVHGKTMIAILTGKSYSKVAPAGLKESLGAQWGDFYKWVTGDFPADWVAVSESTPAAAAE